MKSIEITSEGNKKKLCKKKMKKYENNLKKI